MLNRLLRKSGNKTGIAAPALGAGKRIYAIGDVHGRLDLLERLAGAIDFDMDRSPEIDSTIILLGDLVDRGPDSAGVIDFAREWQQRRKVRILMGNHEEMLLVGMDDPEVLRHFLRFGGRETVLSFGISEYALGMSTLEEVQQLMRDHIPEDDLDFIRGFEDAILVDDYLFVHAGVAPDRPLAEQSPRELRWIRGPFLDHEEPFEHFVIHGHTITDEPEEKSNRIGVDTGAFRSGCLTALVLEGTDRRYIATSPDKGGAVTITTRKAA
jgi:serine/threonine protein phosphatase 1